MKFKYFLLILLLIFLTACNKNEPTGRVVIERNIGEGSTFFTKENAEICSINGKPVIRMYSTSWCPHCAWIRETYTKVVKEYENQGKIVAYEWELDTYDNILTDVKETFISQEEKDVFLNFNPEGSIPTFVFGCKYYRIGNAFEDVNDLEAEEKEFRFFINKLLNEEGEK